MLLFLGVALVIFLLGGWLWRSFAAALPQNHRKHIDHLRQLLLCVCILAGLRLLFSILIRLCIYGSIRCRQVFL